MISPDTTTPSIRMPASPADVDGSTVLGICTSLKPPPGSQGRSAARTTLLYGLQRVGAVYPRVLLLDLRNHPPPFFDGRFPSQYEDEALEFVWSCVDRAGALLLSIPAYWSGVSGVFKNFVDTLCGPIYDMQEPVKTVFADKPTGLLIVGADEASAWAAADQAQQVMRSTGARLVAEPVVVANPRASAAELGSILPKITVLGAQLAQQAYLAGHEP